ncbi:MAG: hypothetical protein WDM94_04620 [Bauldia sp.]
MTGNTLRRFVAVLAAYLVLLHALGMGAMAAPAGAQAGPLLVVCTIDAHASSPASPDHAPAEHTPCALCGLGACAAAPPSDASLPAPVAIAIAPPAAATVSVLPTRVVESAAPRGPPPAA